MYNMASELHKKLNKSDMPYDKMEINHCNFHVPSTTHKGREYELLTYGVLYLVQSFVDLTRQNSWIVAGTG